MQNILDERLKQKLEQALQQKKLNQTAYAEVVKWLTEEEFQEFVADLTESIQNENWEALMDQFYRVVIFGTGGIRGIMDIGTNRINSYTIRWASQAYADYLKQHKSQLISGGVAIAYDSRLNSQKFMEETARVLAANNIQVHIFKYYRATPELSFAVRQLKAAGGIVITASHNPPEFNGYKVYDEHGIQLLPDDGIKIETEFKAVETIKKMTFDEAVDSGLVSYIDDAVDEAFAESARQVSLSTNRDVHIVYSPLHGVGSQSVLPVLQALGFDTISIVKEQESLDGTFPNVDGHFPNPEYAVVYRQAIELAKQENADIVLVSDPDADRLGVAVPDKNGNWTNLTGNQGAVLMGYYYLNALQEAAKLPSQPVVIKTSVTTELVRDIAESFGAEVIGDLLVGFKFIGDRLENLPAEKHFLFACEESVGYLFRDAYRDKGAETAAVVAAEMGAWCRAQGITPLELLDSIYQKHGYYAERLFYREIEGFGSFDRMNLGMAALRQNLPTQIGSWPVLKVMDRLSGEVRDGQSSELIETRDWDKGDMLSFFLSADERTAIHVRPSGTEAKMKYYTMIKGSLVQTTKQKVDSDAEEAEKAIVAIFDAILEKVEVDVF
jgi:phosphoglucomutase